MTNWVLSVIEGAGIAVGGIGMVLSQFADRRQNTRRHRVRTIAFLVVFLASLLGLFIQELVGR